MHFRQVIFSLVQAGMGGGNTAPGARCLLYTRLRACYSLTFSCASKNNARNARADGNTRTNIRISYGTRAVILKGTRIGSLAGMCVIYITTLFYPLPPPK